MQDFRDNEKKQIKNDRRLAILDFISAKWVILVWVLTFFSICMVQLFCFVFELRKYHKISQIRKNSHLKIICSQKLIRSLADIAVHNSKIERRPAGNFFLKRAKEYFFVSGPSN